MWDSTEENQVGTLISCLWLSYHKPVKGFYLLSAEGEGSKIKVLAGVAPTGGPKEKVCPIPLLDSDDRQQSLVFLGL